MPNRRIGSKSHIRRQFPPGVQGFMKYVNGTWIESGKTLIVMIPTHIAHHDRVKVKGIAVQATSTVGRSIMQVRFGYPTEYGNYASRTYKVPANGQLVNFYCKNWDNFLEIGSTQPALAWIDNIFYDRGATYKCYVTYTLYLTFGYTGRVNTCPTEIVLNDYMNQEDVSDQ